MSHFFIYLRQLATISFITIVITSCAIVDRFKGSDEPEEVNTPTEETTIPSENTNTPPEEISFPEETPNTGTIPSSEGDIYEVQPGDTLFSISRSYSCSVTELAEWNNLAPPYHLSIGQKLVVKSSLKTPSSPTVSTHKVVRGDTLSSIAKQYGLTVEELATWNDLAPPYLLKIGQILQISP